MDEAKKAAWDEGRLERVHLKLYDNELKEWMDGHNGRREEYRLLTGLVNGELELKDDDLEFRGRHYDVREAKRLLKKVDKELEEDRQYLRGDRPAGLPRLLPDGDRRPTTSCARSSSSATTST